MDTKSMEERARSRMTAWMRKWDVESSVRQSVRHVLRPEDLQDKELFSPDLCPAAEHPHVMQRGFSSRVRAGQLLSFLDATQAIELDVVNESARLVARNMLDGVEIPPSMQDTAITILTDEAHHSSCAANLRRQVVEITGLMPRSQEPMFLHTYRALLASVPPPYRQHATVIAAISVELLITNALHQTWRDPRVSTPVRAVLEDHARDEAQHHVYHLYLFGDYWPQLDARAQSVLGPLIPQIIMAFVSPDCAGLAMVLHDCQLPPAAIQEVLADSYPAHAVRAEARKAAQTALRLFASLGMFQHPQIAEAFAQSGLL